MMCVRVIVEESNSRTARDMSRNMRLFYFQPKPKPAAHRLRRGGSIPDMVDLTHISE